MSLLKKALALSTIIILLFIGLAPMAQAAPSGYTVTFNNNGHGATSPADAINVVTLTYGDLPAEGTDGYFTFSGWSTTTDASGILTGDYTPVADSTLTAIWVDTTPPPTDPCIANPTALGCPGYIAPPTTYTVTFDNQGHGTTPAPRTGVTSIPNNQLPAEATDGSFTFSGWAGSPSGNVFTPDLGDYWPSADSTLYAIWVDTTPVKGDIWAFAVNANQYYTTDISGLSVGDYINFVKVGSVNAMISPFPTGVSIAAIGTAESSGFLCPTYNCDGSLGIDGTNNVYGITTTYSLFDFYTVAVFSYTPDVAPTTYTVHFDNNGHGVSANDAGNVSSILFGNLPVEATDGYFTFSGWSTTTDASGILTGDYTPTLDSTLTAIWVDTTPVDPCLADNTILGCPGYVAPAITYTVHYDKNGHGIDIVDALAVSTITLTSLPNEATDGYFTFSGW